MKIGPEGTYATRQRLDPKYRLSSHYHCVLRDVCFCLLQCGVYFAIGVVHVLYAFLYHRTDALGGAHVLHPFSIPEQRVTASKGRRHIDQYI